jgi:hypothetical protein
MAHLLSSMDNQFEAEEGLKLTPVERARRCRRLAWEAQQLAEHSTSSMKALYLQLAIQWKLVGEGIVLEARLPCAQSFCFPRQSSASTRALCWRHPFPLVGIEIEFLDASFVERLPAASIAHRKSLSHCRC